MLPPSCDERTPRGHPRWCGVASLVIVGCLVGFGVLQTPSSAQVEERRLTANHQPEDGSTRYRWHAMTKEAEFGGRYAHTGVYLSNGEMLIFGGSHDDNKAVVLNGTYSYDQCAYLNDVWRSRDNGSTWQVVPPESDTWMPRRGHASTLNYNMVSMFVIGGLCGSGCYLNDTWLSEDGAVWTFAGYANWRSRHGHTVVTIGGVTTDTLIMFGGHDGDRYLNDVWKIFDPSTQASDWTVVKHAAEWSPRYGHGAVVRKNRDIVLTGGFFASGVERTCLRDVWVSSDGGASWELVTDSPPWSGRYQHGAVTMSNQDMFVIGGIDVELERLSDAWRSSDGGKTWLRVSHHGAYGRRYEHVVLAAISEPVVFIIGGVFDDQIRYSDTWRSERMCADDVVCPKYDKCRQVDYEPRCLDACQLDPCGIEDNCFINSSTHQRMCKSKCDNFTGCDPKKEFCKVIEGDAKCMKVVAGIKNE
mmetsp:Transcript_31603/g.75770  ORF Transcript_31603/g.75770 Transcript_31603/m.75770 type:complete len:473 (-) Transcript_31603:100-1518(-)